MTAGRHQSTQQRRTGRIIERPRLIKQLDESDAPVILLIGPAGYGKTTLARQWARTLSGVIWVSCTPSHRDVVTFAEDVAAGIDALGGNASRFIGEYMRARSNPQRAAREIGRVLAERTREVNLQWLIVDDYQELAESPEVEELVSVLRQGLAARMLVASRLRPSWASTRKAVYGETNEIGATDLALNEDETRLILGGRRPELDFVVERACGWPAVVALAAALDSTTEIGTAVAPALHRYVAEELFRSAHPELQDDLISLALVPRLDPPQLRAAFGEAAETVIAHARDLGFLTDEEQPELHPLLREFLLAKLATDPDADTRVRAAVMDALDCEAWESAMALVLRFELLDFVDPVLRQAFKPLIRAGRLGTLSYFAQRIREVVGFSAPAVDVIDAEVALRDGQFELAVSLADRAVSHLVPKHELLCRAHLIDGRIRFFQADFGAALDAYECASAKALDESDELEALYGLASVQVFGETGDPTEAVDRLYQHRHRSPDHMLRAAVATLINRLFTKLDDPLPFDEGLYALRSSGDPHSRSAFSYAAATILAQRGEYLRARGFLELFQQDAQRFELEFAQPFAAWTGAFIEQGLRRFGEADRYLRVVERAVATKRHENHELNVRVLRARLLILRGSAPEAIELLTTEPRTPVFASWRGELLATRGMALACAGANDDARASAVVAQETSRFVNVSVLAQATIAVAAEENASAELQLLFDLADRTCTWDPVIFALRSSQTLAGLAARSDLIRPRLIRLIQTCGDSVMARQAGLRAKTIRSANDVLSPREREVLGLIAQGLRNREIAKALFIAESTVKVHTRHILEKLGVRTRAEAVGLFERADADG